MLLLLVSGAAYAARVVVIVYSLLRKPWMRRQEKVVREDIETRKEYMRGEVAYIYRKALYYGIQVLLRAAQAICPTIGAEHSAAEIDDIWR